jgi:hypothetical protein
MALQRVHALSILRRAVTVGEGSSRLGVYRVYLPFLICFKQLVEVLVLSGSFTTLWATSFGLFACLDFGPGPLFFLLSLSWVPSFYKLWQAFIIYKNIPTLYTMQLSLEFELVNNHII